MGQGKTHVTEVQQKTEPARQLDQEVTRQPEQGPVQQVAPEAAYRRAQVGRNGLRPADLLILQKTVGNRRVQRMVVHPLTRIVQQNAARQTTEQLVQRNGKTNPSNLQKLDELLDKVNVPEEEVIDLLGHLTSKEKVIVLAGYKAKIADALNIGEMVRAVDSLDPDLATKLEWVESAATFRSQIDYANIQGMITKATQKQRDALNSEDWQKFFVAVCTNVTIIEAVNDLGFDLKTKLQWIEAETTSVRAELSYAEIKKIVQDAEQREKDTLNTEEWRDFFVAVCTNVTIIEALEDLAFDPITRANWVRAEGGAELIPKLFISMTAAQILSIFNSFTASEFTLVTSGMDQTQTSDFLAKLLPADKTAYPDLIERIKATRLVATGEAMQGQLRWLGGSGPETGAGYKVSETTAWGFQNDFAKWVRGTGREPTASSTMNCWEAVLFMAYKAGLVQKPWIDALHADAAKAGDAAAATGGPAAGATAYYDKLENQLYAGARTPFIYDPTTKVGSPDIPGGNIIFVNKIGHVMFSKGTKTPAKLGGKHEVISHWIFPSPGRPSGTPSTGSAGTIQSTTLEEILETGRMTSATVEFAKPPW